MTTDSIMVMGARSETSYLLIHHLAARFVISHVVFEAPRRRKMLRYRLRTLGWRVVFNQLLFLAWDRLVIQRQSRARIEQLLAGHDHSPPDDRLNTLDVESVNSRPMWDLVAAQRPPVIVVTGTGIIGKRLLGLGQRFINIHCGITPRYRGVHGAFWAVVEGRPELAGTTIHLIDPGLDTGPILAQVPITVDAQDTYRTLPVKQYLAGLEPMARAVESALAGTLEPYQRTDLASHQWYSPSLRDYWTFTHAIRSYQSG
jgi:folate-dependent phosphoribosylglycinamide formyltransferase PurN